MTYPDDWFERKVLARLTNTDQPDACWEWGGYRDRKGYGRVTVPGECSRLTHRVAYAQLVGPIPAGLGLDHLCRNTSCANPRHLEPVTNQVNTARGATVTAENSSRTHCPRGHALTGDNLTPSDLARGLRRCRTCDRAHSNEQRDAINAARRALGLKHSGYRSCYGMSIHVAREIVRRLNAGEPLDGVRDLAPGHGHHAKRTIVIPADPNRA